MDGYYGQSHEFMTLLTLGLKLMLAGTMNLTLILLSVLIVEIWIFLWSMYTINVLIRIINIKKKQKKNYDIKI